MYKISDILKRSNLNAKGLNSYTEPNTGYVNSNSYKIIKEIANGIKEVSTLNTSDTTTNENDIDALLTPPSEVFSDIVPPEGEEISNQIDNLVPKQFVQQFYEAYMVPTGSKEIYNRLGTVAGNITDLHSLYPNGVKGLVAKDVTGAWRTNLNFSFKIDEGLGGSTQPAKYSSLAFPPFINHDTFNANNLAESASTVNTASDYITDTTFDMENILFKRNEATYRLPAFKQINDNIHLLQVFLNRCFGIESTYINEWDLSMYMQEGLMSFTEKLDSSGETIKLPQFVTTLTYGLLDDAPLEALQKRGSKTESVDLDLDAVSTFASLNLAVSTRYGIDDQQIGQQANETDYIISQYPYSTYWYPNDSGNLAEDFNMSNYVKSMFSYDLNGYTYDEKNKKAKNYTPAIYHGDDLSKSTKRFLEIINYEDCRHAVLSGWNGTDEQGNRFLSLGDTTNDSVNSNAFSYLPFWKQFYTSSEDGLTDIDLYMQEIAANGKEVSFLSAAQEIIGMISGSNQTFNDLCSAARDTKTEDTKTEDDDYEGLIDDFQNTDGTSSSSYSDYGFKIAKVKFTIPGSKLLKMFLNRDKTTKKAKKAADKSANFDSDTSTGTTSSTMSSASVLKNATPTKVLNSPTTTIVDGKEVEVTEYAISDTEALCTKKTIEDGVAEYSPFLYGGPHGKYYSPLTVEGYTQYNNRNLANVPTVDPYSSFEAVTNNEGIRPLELSKNYKLYDSYIDTVIALTPNEREALLKDTTPFGVKDMGPNTKHWVRYTSNYYYREYFHDWRKRIRIRILWHKFYIPNPFYWKIARITNGSREKWLRYSYDYGTGVNYERSHTTELRESVSVQPDWINTDFKLLPVCGWLDSFSVNNSDSGWDSNTTYNHIKHDESTFNKNSTYKIENNKKVYTYNAAKDKIKSSCVKWMIVPNDVSGTTVCGTKNGRYAHFTSYSQPGTTWYNQLKNLYVAGTREMSVTLPIKDSNDNILEIICGVANISRSDAITYIWTPKVTYHWRYLFRRSRRRWRIVYKRWWRWRKVWYWVSRIVRTRCYHYSWYLKQVETDAYNMFFRPNKVQWILPTNTLLEKEAASVSYSERDISSTNIIKRYSLEGTTFKHISADKRNDPHSPDLFPFTIDFMNKYGKEDSYAQLPGVSTRSHSRNMNNLKVLHSKGFYYGNILDSYKKEGKVLSISKVISKYETWRGPIYYNDTASGNRFYTKYRIGKLSISIHPTVSRILNFFFGRLYEKKSIFGVEREVLWTANTLSWEASKYETQEELTKILDECQTYKSIQEYQIDEKTKYMNWYDPTDAISVYVDTITQQIAWLKQLRDYANIYLSDQLIYEVYTNSVDNNIKDIIEYNYRGDSKNGDNYTATGGKTESFTEDINYTDALAIVRRVFNTTDSNKNTIYELTVKRIERFEALLKEAKTIKENFFINATTSMHQFMRLVTNTKSYTDCTVTDGTSVEDAIFDSSGNYVDYLFPVTDDSVFNILKNPAAVLWAYINVLYHVRKYWVNVRLNKRAGSYWQLRGLERVLVFLLAQNNSENSSSVYQKIPISTGETLLKTNQIMYVQPRTAFNAQVQSTNTTNIVNTQAVYIKVDYLGTPEPEKSSKWNSETQTYDGSEIVYVKEVYKYARKPEDSLYYIMSTAITNNINNYSKVFKNVLTQISSQKYKVTEEDYKQTINLIEQSKVLTTEEITTLENIIDPMNKTVEDCITGIKTLTDYNIASLQNIYTIFVNNLANYKRNYFIEQIESTLYAVYIKWQPQQVWTGLREDDSNGSWHIDKWQKEDTYNKERKVTDLYGYEHTSSEAISAGITFDVVAGINPSTILSSPTALRNSSLLEILCSSVDKIDLWRVEIPEDLNIPVTLLEDKPILVPAYQIDTALNGLKTGEVVKSSKSVLAGVATNSVSPILEATEDMLTINTLSALGKITDVSTTGLNLTDLQNSGN